MSNSPTPSSPSHQKGIELFRAGQYDEARRAFEEARAEAQRADDRQAEGQALNDLGAAYQKLRQHDQARQSFEAAIRLFADLGDDRRRAQAMGNLGTLLGEMKKHREAIIRLEQAADVFTRIGDKQSAALTLKWLSRTYLQNWDFLEAIFAYERALARLEPLPPDQALLRKLLQIPMRILSRGT